FLIPENVYSTVGRTALDQQELLRTAERCLPGACLGMMALPPDLRMVMLRGRGSRVYDAAGKEYLDYMLGSGPLLLGHGDPEAAVVRHADELAAVIVEPLQRSLRPEPGFLERLRAVTRRHGIVLVFDEIVTGFRLAWGGAQERYGVVPDLACLGKVIGGGYPV